MPQNPFRGQNTAESLGLSASITLAKQLSFDFAKPGVVDISMLCSSVSFKSHADTETNQTSCSAIMIKRQNLKKKNVLNVFVENYKAIFSEKVHMPAKNMIMPCKFVQRKIREDHYKCQNGILAFLFNLAT